MLVIDGTHQSRALCNSVSHARSKATRVLMLYIKDVARWREDINFMFEWQEQYIFTCEDTENTPLQSRM